MTRAAHGLAAPRALARMGGAACLAAWLAACSSDRREAERAVRAYNQAAILAYRTRDPSGLREVATEKEWRKVLVLVDLKTANGLALEAEMESLELTSVARPGPDSLRVGSRERWRYHDRPLQPGKRAGTVFVADMTLQYDFVRQGGGWKLDEARTLSSEYLEPRGYRPGREHGHGAEERGEPRAREEQGGQAK